MKFTTSALAIAPLFAAICMDRGAAAQAYGPWVHDNATVPLSIYVAPPPLGSDANPGNSPTLPLATPAVAVTMADQLLAATWPALQTGVTINLMPGTYSMAAPLSVPAFGIAIESYGCTTVSAPPLTNPPPPTGATLRLQAPSLNDGVVQFDRQLGPACLAGSISPVGMPGSVLRGVAVDQNSSGYGVLIDPTRNPVADLASSVVTAVEVNQCQISNASRGIRIDNQSSLDVPYANLIVDNEIFACSRGIEVLGASLQSDLLRSNRIFDCGEGISIQSQTGATGDMHTRVLSNAIFNAVNQFGIHVQNSSATIVNNTIAFVAGPPSMTPPASIAYGGTGVGETLIVANNILFSPATPLLNPAELQFSATPFGGTLVVVNNDYDMTSPSPELVASATNVAIASPQFVSMVAPFDVHLTDISPALVNLGDQGFVLPGPQTTITVGSLTFGANCALDMDLDARTHVPGAGTAVVLHRGADQYVDDLVRLSAPTQSGGAQPHQLADVIGTMRPAPAGNTEVLLAVSGSAGAAVTFLCSTLPMGPELQHAAVPGLGSIAIDGGSSVQIGSGALPFQAVVDLGTLVPAFVEAEMYVQSVVLHPNGSMTFSNRIRLEADRN